MVEYGDPRMPQRFWDKTLITESGCWEWIACIGAGGYGRYGIGHSTSFYAHRVAYEHLVALVPPSMELDHICHTQDESCAGGHCRHRRCVNPNHLEPVTGRENSLRGHGVGAIHAAKTHCVHGHPFDDENTKFRQSPRGSVRRDCRQCAANRDAKRRRSHTVVPGWVG